jgi:hypothetical protein
MQLNNQALVHMMEGNHNETVGALGTALTNLKMYQELGSAAVSSSVSQHKPLHGNEVQDMSTRLCSIPLSSSSNSSGDYSIFTLFDRALVIPQCPEITGNTDRIMAMLLYNMGLCLHLQATSSGKALEMDGALQLYEMAFSVVEDAWAEFDVDDLMLLLLALFNNMGIIHSSRFENAKTRTCLDWLSTLAANPIFQSLMEKPEYTPFFMNLLVAMKQQTHTCSPAA